MNDIISKFNLYEYFRILLPGFYSVYIIYEWLKSSNSALLSKNDLIISLLIIVFSLLIGTLIYAIDLCRLFKKMNSSLPTNMMEEEYPEKYPKSKKRKNEHIYYSWYNNAPQPIRSKTELQSGLYHLSMNFALVALFGIISCLFRIDFCSIKNIEFLQMNIALFILAVITAFVIVNRRLKYNWLSNYWTFEVEVIKQVKKENGD